MGVQILLVDENPNTEAVLVGELRPSFSIVRINRVAGSADFARALEDGAFDLMIAKDQSSWSDGLSLVRTVRARYPECPVILLAASGHHKTFVDALKAGASACVLWSPKWASHLSVAVTRSLRRVHAYRKAVRAESRLRAIIYHSDVGVFRSTLAGSLLEANPAFLRLVGLSSVEEAKGANLFDLLFPGEDRNGMLSRLNEERRLTGYEIQKDRASGGPIWARLSASVRSLGEGEFELEGILQDVTQQHQSAHALRDSLGVYTSLVENLPQCIFRKDQAGRFVFANGRFCNLAGVSLGELVGKTDFDLYPANLASKYQRDDEQVCSTEEVFEAVEDHEPPGQKRILVQVVKTPVYNAAGRVVGVQGIFWDVTERKRTEEELVESQRQLRALASELALAEERERRRIASQLHDHVGPAMTLAKIKLGGLRQALASTAHAGLVDEIGAHLDQIIKDTRSLIFAISPPILYELGFGPALEWLAEYIQDRHGLVCDAEIDPQLVQLDLELRVVLFQAVRELLTNAVKHAQATEGKIVVRAVGDRVEVEVADNGIGFKTSEAGWNGHAAGGFGLFALRTRLQFMGGDLQIESAPGQGTRATVTTPYRRAGDK